MLGLVGAWYLARGRRKYKRALKEAKPDLEVVVEPIGAPSRMRPRRKKSRLFLPLPVLAGLWVLGVVLNHWPVPALKLDEARNEVAQMSLAPKSSVVCRKTGEHAASCRATDTYGCERYTVRKDRDLVYATTRGRCSS
jgi:hypothetical protein